MNKYQEFVKNNIQFVLFLDSELKEFYGSESWQNIGDEFVLKQAEDYNITKYYVMFNGATIDSVTYKGKEYKVSSDNPRNRPFIIICLDFNDKQKELVFNSRAVDSFSVPLKFIDVDHEIHDSKVAKEQQDKLAEKAKIKISTGADLVNVYFQPCSDNYGKTEIELYLANGNYSHAPSVMGKHDVFHPQLLSATPDQMIGKFTVDDGMMFKSVTGLAHHAYAVKVSQFDKEGKLLFKTDYKYFDIR